MSWLRTPEEAAAERAEQAERAAIAAEFDREVAEACAGAIEDLEARLVTLDEEAATLRGQYARARAQAEAQPREFGEEFARVDRRAQQVPEIRGAVERRRLALIAERGEQLAAQWNKNAAKLLAPYLRQQALELAPAADLLAAFEAAVATGATARLMAPIAPAAVSAVIEFVAYVEALRRRGVAVDTKDWPAAVLARIS